MNQHAVSDASSGNQYDSYEDTTYDSNDLPAWLTDVERAALQPEPAAGTPPEEPASADPAPAEPVPESTPAPTEPPVEQAAVPEPAEPTPSAPPQDTPVFVPQFQQEAPADLRQQFDALIAERVALKQQLADGEIDMGAYHDKLAQLTDQISDIRQQASMAEFASRQNQRIMEQRWQWEQDVFMKDNRQFADDPILRGALDAQLRLQYADPAKQGLSGLEHLRAAGQSIMARFAPQSVAPQPAPDAAPIPPKPEQAKPDLGNVPQTLAQVPAAAVNGDEFADINRLTGLAREAALARLTPEQFERYLAS